MTGLARPSTGGIRGIHVLAAIVAFFGVVFAVNGVFLYQALSTHTGVVSKQPYRKGLGYNERIAADQRQARLGWAPAIRFERTTGRLVVAIGDGNGSPVAGLAIAGLLGRPATAQYDAKLALRETQAGRYEAAVGDLGNGIWLVQLEAGRGRPDGSTEVVYRLRKRLWIKH